MKDFDLQDVFLLSKIIDKMELKFESDKLSKTIKSEKLENKDDAAKLGKEVMLSLGIDLITKIISNMHKADKEVIQFIANLTEKNIEAVRKMKLKEIKQFFVDLVGQEDFKDFFSQAEDSSQ